MGEGYRAQKLSTSLVADRKDLLKMPKNRHWRVLISLSYKTFCRQKLRSWLMSFYRELLSPRKMAPSRIQQVGLQRIRKAIDPPGEARCGLGNYTATCQAVGQRDELSFCWRDCPCYCRKRSWIWRRNAIKQLKIQELS